MIRLPSRYFQSKSLTGNPSGLCQIALEAYAVPSGVIEIRAKAPAMVLLLLATVAILSVFFGPVLWGGQVYYPGDTARVYLPQQSALGRSLTRGALPW